MYVVTGGAGFIGSAFVAYLNERGIHNIVVVDELGSSARWKNLRGKHFADYFHKDEFLALLSGKPPFGITAIIHLGACSSTTEQDCDFLMRNNYRYSVTLAEFCRSNNVRFIYASSAATYGDGAKGYSDRIQISELQPLNPYGFSKHLFDQYLQEHGPSSFAVGLKFFNVFGPNEYHKGGMVSVALRAWEQARRGEPVKLFKSYRPEYPDGEQKRDFIYVKDCCEVMWWFLQNPSQSGLFNLGTGTARSWNDLARAVCSALNRPANIQYVEMPTALREQYQYFTCAEMQKLTAAGCSYQFRSLEASVADYVQNYLEPGQLVW